MVLLLAITFVLVAELVNTAIEAAVDIASTSFDPMAKIAKDIAAGAVLIAALNAVAVGYLVFSGAVANRSSRFLDKLAERPRGAHARRAGGDDHRRHRDQGDHGPRDSAPRRPALRTRRGRVRRLDGGYARAERFARTTS